ncbi:MAG: hypothetical protein HYW50_02175 [Candidatus Diapherotrites archaeon]|nr:hypothetical protein [Candidatus Diapherotrites archaeon]
MNILKFVASIVLVNSLRLVRLFPNNDPIMGVMLPFSRQKNLWSAAFFAFIAMFSFDLITSGIGIWTWVTALTYAGLGILFHFYYKNKKKVSMKTYLGSGIFGVLIFDLITGVLFGPAMFGTPMELAFFAQIPFTLLHLLSASAYIVILTPFLDRHLVGSSNFTDSKIAGRLLSLLKAKL